jgi:thymidylate kinase
MHAPLPRRVTHLILLDVEPEVGLERVAARSPERDVHETLEHLKEKREAYLSTCADPDFRWSWLAPDGLLATISATPPALEVHQRIIEALGI